jgi:peptidoglycan hydrolase CwlO-like protein
MKSLSLVLRFVAIAAGIAAVVVFFLINGKLAEKESALTSAQASRAALQSELETSEATISSLRSERDSARSEAESTRRNLENTRSELVAARSEASRSADRLREAQRELERANQDLTTVRRDLVTAQRQVERGVSQSDFEALQTERDTLQGRVRELRDELEQAREEVRTARATTVPAQREVVEAAPRDRQLGRTTPATTGRFGASTAIAAVDTKSGLLVLSGGENLGVSGGDTVRLVSNLQAVADIQIARINGNETLAHILPGSPTRKLRSGLEVRILH